MSFAKASPWVIPNLDENFTSMHAEVLSPEQLRSPIPTDAEISGGRSPLDIDGICSGLDKIGTSWRAKSNFWADLPGHDNFVIEHVFRLHDTVIHKSKYKIPWFDPGTSRWEETSSDGLVLMRLASAVQRLADYHKSKYQIFEAAALEECVRIRDTRNPTAARTLAFLLCFLRERNPNNSQELYLELERRGIVEATLLAPHWKTIYALSYHLSNERLVQRITAYLQKACKRPHADKRWGIIAHYLAGLGYAGYGWNQPFDRAPQLAVEKFECVKRMAKNHLEAIGQELEANYSLIVLDDPSISTLQSLSHDGDTMERQDDDKVMGLDHRFWMLCKDHDSRSRHQTFLANIKALKKEYPHIDKFDTAQYISTSLYQPKTDASALNRVVLSSQQVQAVTKQWPDLGVDSMEDALDSRVLQDNSNSNADLLYASVLVNVARDKIDPSFQDFIQSLFPENHHPGSVKTLGRIFFKATEDYHERDPPRAACVRDIVRCTLVFRNCSELVKAYEEIESRCHVVGVKNSFVDKKTAYGYRQVLVSILHKTRGGDQMICEIQMQLESFVSVKDQLRVYYEIFRCDSWRATQNFVGPESRTYGHLGESCRSDDEELQ